MCFFNLHLRDTVQTPFVCALNPLEQIKKHMLECRLHMSKSLTEKDLQNLTGKSDSSDDRPGYHVEATNTAASNRPYAPYACGPKSRSAQQPISITFVLFRVNSYIPYGNLRHAGRFGQQVSKTKTCQHQSRGTLVWLLHGSVADFKVDLTDTWETNTQVAEPLSQRN